MATQHHGHSDVKTKMKSAMNGAKAMDGSSMIESAKDIASDVAHSDLLESVKSAVKDAVQSMKETAQDMDIQKAIDKGNDFRKRRPALFWGAVSALGVAAIFAFRPKRH